MTTSSAVLINDFIIILYHIFGLRWLYTAMDTTIKGLKNEYVSHVLAHAM